MESTVIATAAERFLRLHPHCGAQKTATGSSLHVSRNESTMGQTAQRTGEVAENLITHLQQSLGAAASHDAASETTRMDGFVSETTCVFPVISTSRKRKTTMTRASCPCCTELCALDASAQPIQRTQAGGAAAGESMRQMRASCREACATAQQCPAPTAACDCAAAASCGCCVRVRVGPAATSKLLHSFQWKMKKKPPFGLSLSGDQSHKSGIDLSEGLSHWPTHWHLLQAGAAVSAGTLSDSVLVPVHLCTCAPFWPPAA